MRGTWKRRVVHEGGSLLGARMGAPLRRHPLLITYGVYRFAPRRVAYRQDYCLVCEAERVSVRIRSFFVGHVYGIPLLPVGFFRQWRCASCGNDPARRARTSRSQVVELAVVVGLLAAILMAMSVVVGHAHHPDVGLLGVALGTWALTGMLAFVARRMRPDVDRKARLTTLRQASTLNCPFCQGGLVPKAPQARLGLHCPACRIDREVA